MLCFKNSIVIFFVSDVKATGKYVKALASESFQNQAVTKTQSNILLKK